MDNRISDSTATGFGENTLTQKLIRYLELEEKILAGVDKHDQLSISYKHALEGFPKGSVIPPEEADAIYKTLASMNNQQALTEKDTQVYHALKKELAEIFLLLDGRSVEVKNSGVSSTTAHRFFLDEDGFLYHT
jgi:hypothetical protein